jgi:hypothetical protein
MRNHNGGENMPVTSGRMDMDIYDKLPKAVRKALQEADHNWSGEQLYRAWKRRQHGLRTAEDCVRFIRVQDAKVHRRDAEAGIVCPDQR